MRSRSSCASTGLRCCASLGRSVPFSSLAAEDEEPSVAQERFLGDDTRFPGHWAAPPRRWEGPERLLARETLELIEREIAALPPAQAIVLTMRDVNGLDAADVGDGCSTCVEQMRATIAAIGRLTPADVPRELQRRLVDVFRTWKSA